MYLKHLLFVTRVWVSVLVSAAIATTVAQAETRSCTGEGFLPKNDMKVSRFSLSRSAVTEQKFNAILDKVAKYYSPVVAQNGGSLYIDRKWSDDTVNAYAKRNGKTWIIEMYGGMARHPSMTEDGFTLIACHEMGHHLGGAPKYQGQWAANEGQSDYFATLKCLRNVFADENNVDIVKTLNPDPIAVAACEKSFGDANSIAICTRNAMAGSSAANLMRQLEGSTQIAFNTPDPTIVSVTLDGHPRAQCRLDTYFEGSICQVAASQPLSQTDPTVGTCSIEHNDKIGVRPQCWYKPSTGGPTPQPTPTPTPGSGIARQPLILGQTQTVVNNPYVTIQIAYDVSEFPGAAGAYVEISAPNRDFVQPNGVTPDPYRLRWASQGGVRGVFAFVPYQTLAGWGTYSIRVIPLDTTGQAPVGRFSTSSKLVMTPSLY